MSDSIRQLLEELRVTPWRVRDLCAAMPPDKLRRRPGAERFGPIEDAWHLRDIECEGHGVRIRRMLGEIDPVLESIDGDRLALERRYLERELEPALAGFERARTESLGLLAQAQAADWSRSAVFEGRTLTLLDYLRSMVEHDRAHLSSLDGVYVSSKAA